MAPLARLGVERLVMEDYEALVRLTCAILSGNPDIAVDAAVKNAVKALKAIEQEQYGRSLSRNSVPA